MSFEGNLPTPFLSLKRCKAPGKTKPKTSLGDSDRDRERESQENSLEYLLSLPREWVGTWVVTLVSNSLV